METTETGASSILRTSGALSADHELLRNLILTAGVTISNDDYEESDVSITRPKRALYDEPEFVRQYRLSICISLRTHDTSDDPTTRTSSEEDSRRNSDAAARK